MTADMDRIIVVTGATGLQGGAVTRRLLSNGWRVRALTRNAKSEMAQALSAVGAEVVQGDMAEPDSLVPVFEGTYGVFSVQNPMISGAEGEINQGKNVADLARRVGVQHLIYASTGTGVKGTGISSKDLSTMWRWLRSGEIDMGTETTLAIHPEALSVRAWLENHTGWIVE